MAEYDTSGTMLHRYIHGLSAGDDPQVWFEGSTLADSARRYLYADERGSIVAVTDSTGNVLNVNRYDEYGIPASTNVGAFQYTGQVYLPELGMYHYKARMYSPTLGRFMQTDPIGYGDGMNMYNYVGSDPVNGVDPSGMEADSSGECAKDAMAPIGANSPICVRGRWQPYNEYAPPTGLYDMMFRAGRTEGGYSDGVATGVDAWSQSRDPSAAPEQVPQSVENTIVVTGSAIRRFPGNAGRILSGPFRRAFSDFVDWTRVGRWMDPAEAEAMIESGQVQPNESGATHVTVPANPRAWVADTKGRVFMTFYVVLSE